MARIVQAFQQPVCRLLATVLTCALLAACGGAPIDKSTPATEAESVYLEGMEHLAGGSMLEAEQEFQKLLKMPSYLQLTALARVRLGDAQFNEHKYDEAIETWLSFMQRHDTNPNVPYALFMVAKAHYEMAPSDIWIMPPVEELDLTAVQQARVHLERFIKQYPTSRFATEAIALRDRCIDLQWSHNRFVVKFYEGRKKWIGVVFRMHQGMQRFPSRSQNVENFALLAEAYDQLHWRRRAVEMAQAVAHRWPGTSEATRAVTALARLNEEIKQAKKAGDPAAEMPVELPPTASIKPEQLADQLQDEG
jgi:outer membrane protein assembly factor BamD